ncbi:hypothetical protein GALL_306830 [mine drainage metagenome]|uniref:Uncharacterized protein n=1 Tax=mine drainage metagenome TaxID=410659 RepID=A0A1J5QV84_9ZZZZ
MPEAVVDLLEVVEVEEQDGQTLAVAPGGGDRQLQAVVEQHAIGQAGQGVVVRHVADMMMGPTHFEQLPHALAQDGNVQRLGDEIRRTALKGPPHRNIVVQPGDHHHLRPPGFFLLLQHDAGIESVHARHHAVHQDNVRLQRFAHGDGLGAIDGLLDLVAFLFHCTTQHQAHGQVVFHHQYQGEVQAPARNGLRH